VATLGDVRLVTNKTLSDTPLVSELSQLGKSVLQTRPHHEGIQFPYKKGKLTCVCGNNLGNIQDSTRDLRNFLKPRLMTAYEVTPDHVLHVSTGSTKLKINPMTGPPVQFTTTPDDIAGSRRDIRHGSIDMRVTDISGVGGYDLLPFTSFYGPSY
jgi:hypothetical protein